MNWQPVLPGVWKFRDSCNVYAVEGPAGTLVVNAGTGRWLERLDQLPSRPTALACTHYFRDHSAGAAAAARAGIPVFVPEYEEAVFADPVQHFRQRETYIIYDNLWDLFAPIEPVPLAGALRDYEIRTLAGIAVEVLPLPGATLTQSGLGVTLPDGRRAALCGEAIHSPGRLARVAPLQYNYNDLPGAVQCEIAARTLRAWKPDILLPSLGEPMLAGADSALAQLQENLRALIAVRPGMSDMIRRLDGPALQKVTEHVYLDLRSVANTWYLLSDTGKALAIDYGYEASFAAPGYPKPERRRALLHGLDALKAQFGIEKIDVVLVSHFHDDHVCGIPLLQRLHGTRCWAAENFADLLEYPHAHCFPCNWPVAARVDRRLPLGTPFTWEEYTFQLHPMSGHTRFAALIGFEADGVRFAHTGDQYFFNGGAGVAADGFLDDFASRQRAQNHVYRNGALRDGYRASGAWMKRWRPEIVLQGHQSAFRTDDAFFAHMDGWVEDYETLHRRLMPLEEEETHFDLDSGGGWIWPYRVHRLQAEAFSVQVTVRNPLPRPASLTVRLVGPEGWEGEEATLEAQAHAEVSGVLRLCPSGPCRRQPFAVELAIEGQPFGQVAEALATLGEPRF